MHDIRKNILRGLYGHQHCHIHHSRCFLHQCLGIDNRHVVCVFGCQRQFEQLLFWRRLPHAVRHRYVAIRPVHYAGHTRRLLFAHAMGWLLVLETLASPPLYQIHHEDIVMRELFPRGWLAIYIAVIISSLIYIQFLTLFNVHYSQWDSVTLIISIVGQILTTFRFVEQWVTWLCLDIFNVIWWFLVLYPQNGDLTMAVMWAFKLINVFYGWYTWKKLGKAQTKLVSGPYCPYEPQFTRHYWHDKHPISR